jgi:uncharacterized protein (TIGR02611 family)
MSVDPKNPSTDEVELAAAIAAGDVDDELDELAPALAASEVVSEARKRRRTVLLIRKVVLTLVGLAIMAVGVVMMVAPGPGVIVIVAGLFVLSFEYEWAQRRFEQLRDKAVDAAHATARSTWQLTLAIASSIAIIGGAIVWGLQEDWPFSSWTLSASLIGSGLLALGTVVWSVFDVRRHPGTAGA